MGSIRTVIVFLLTYVAGGLTQDCSLSNICYKNQERVLDKFPKEVCVCPFAPCIPVKIPCPGVENVQFDGIAPGTKLPAGTFKEWGELNALSIHQGPPVNITKEVFKSQRPHLRILELDTFSIENIEVGAFSGFRKLEILDIRPSKVHTIQRNTFRGLSSLKVLKLYSGNLSVLRTGAFNGLDNLQRLWLLNNRIEHIQNGLFDNLGKLEELRLSYNNIHRIDPYAFSKLSNLRSLECWDMKMRSLSPEILDGLQTVQSLNFGKNAISTIDIGSFSEMENLETLILSKNNLTFFSLIDLYLPLPNLLTLDLEFNQIDNILFPTTSEEPLLANLTKFVLKGNQLEAVPRFILDNAPVINSGYAPVPIDCECYEISNFTDPSDSLVPSLSCPNTCTIPKVDCTPTLVEMNDLREMPLIVITCNVTGNPTPSVTWKRPNGGIILGDYNPWEGVTNLYLTDIGRLDLGKYACIVENQAGTVKSVSTINLLESSTNVILPNIIVLFFMIILHFVY